VKHTQTINMYKKKYRFCDYHGPHPLPLNRINNDDILHMKTKQFYWHMVHEEPLECFHSIRILNCSSFKVLRGTCVASFRRIKWTWCLNRRLLPVPVLWMSLAGNAICDKCRTVVTITKYESFECYRSPHQKYFKLWDFITVINMLIIFHDIHWHNDER